MPVRRSSRQTLHAAFLASAALAAISALAGCITERTGYKPRGVPVAPGDSSSSLDLSSALQPASAATALGRARFAIIPLGAVRYDGLTLPILSPDGRFLASQVTDPPTWPCLLGLPGDGRADLARVQLFRLTADAVVPIDTSAELPRGLLLGRSASARGVLVEAPQPDGSRFIGRLDWSTGQVAWLIREPGIVAAHAIELRDGSLIYCRRAAGDVPFALTLRAPGRPEVTVPTPGECVLYPIASPSQRYVGFMAVRWNPDNAAARRAPTVGRGPEWGAMDLVSLDLAAPGGPAIAGRFRIADAGSPRQAFQCAAGQEATPADVATLPAPATNASPAQNPRLAEPRDTITLVAPRWDGVALLGVATGNVARLATRAVAASLVDSPSGPAALVSTDRDLLFIENPTRAPARGASPFPPSSRVMTQPMIARVISPAGSELPFGPGQTEVVGLALDPSAPEHVLKIVRLKPVEGP